MGSHQQSLQALDAYCRRLTDALEAQGYVIIHASDLKNAPGLPEGRLRDGVRAQYLRAKSVYEEQNNVELMIQLDRVRNGNGAYCCKETKAIVLPDRDGLLENFARTHKLNPAKLRGAGVRDLHIYAEYLVHEASHVTGNDGIDFTPESFLRGEFQVHALTAARLMQAGGAQMKPIVRLLAAIKFQNPFQLQDQYMWSLDAVDWVLQNFERSPDVWRKDKQGFLKDTFNSFARFGGADGLSVRRRPMEMAQDALQRYGMVPFFWDKASANDRLAMRDAAMDAAEDVARAIRTAPDSGKKMLQEAATILRQTGRSLDRSLKFADGYYKKGTKANPPRLPRSLFDMDLGG